MRCVEPGCDAYLARPDRALRCKPCANAHKAQDMEGWTPSEDTRRRMVEGARARQARESGRPVITEAMVAEARQRLAQGQRLKDIAAWLGVKVASASVYIKHGSYAAYRQALRQQAREAA